MAILLRPDSAVVALAVELYERHRPDEWRRCACGVPRCCVRVRAVAVMRAAGLEPSLNEPSTAMTEATVPLPVLKLSARVSWERPADEPDARYLRSDWWGGGPAQER
jgi:hypothetical protein